jgi:hypothetical protein
MKRNIEAKLPFDLVYDASIQHAVLQMRSKILFEDKVLVNKA